MSDKDGDDKFSLNSEEMNMLREMFGITTHEQERRFLEVIDELQEAYGYIDKQVLVQRLMKEFGIDSEYLDQIQKDIADLNMDHLDHLLQKSLKFNNRCDVCDKLHSELCDHLSDTDRLEILLQMGKAKQGLEFLESLDFDRLEYLLWRIRFLIINHRLSEIKEALDEASMIIYDDDDMYNIFRVQVLKIHYLLDQRQYDEALKVADSISPFAEQLEMDDNPAVTYWMASLSQGMASALLKMGQIQVALDPLLVSTELFIDIKNQYQVGVSFALISSVMGMLQEEAQAEKSARIALKLMRELENEFGLIRVKTFVASGFLALFKTEIALDYATEALEVAKTLESDMVIAALYGLLSQIYIVEQEFDKAMKVATKCYEYAEGHEVNEVKAIAISLKGDIHAEQNHIAKAIEYYEKAIEELEDGKDDQLILDLDRRIANLEGLK